nr:MAG TPA: Integrase [Caudoviricetes sp.]
MLPIRRRCHFLLDTQKGWKALKIRYRIRYGGGYVTSVFIGHRAEPDKWSRETERCLKNTTHGDDRIPASVINRDLQATEEAVGSAFSYFEEQEYLPTPEELKAKYAEIIGSSLGLKIQKPTTDIAKSDRLLDQWDRFVEVESIRRSWGERQLANLRTTRMHIERYDNKATFSSLSSEWVGGLVHYLTNKRVLQNASVDKTLRTIKRFLSWARQLELYDKDYRPYFNVRLKGADANRSEVYLTWEELSRLYTVDLRLHSERVARDLFCFLCFTGLRYSDLKRLTHDNITEKSIRFHSQKTDTYTEVDLNDYSRAILNRYKGSDRPLPTMAEQRLNRTIKEVCKQAGIDAPITRLRYSGSSRTEDTRPKYEFVTSHIGRHTFVVTALTLGIPSEVIRKFTGHKTEKTMRPYLAIVDKLKAQEMAKFNRPLTTAVADD